MLLFSFVCVQCIVVYVGMNVFVHLVDHFASYLLRIVMYAIVKEFNNQRCMYDSIQTVL